MVSVREKRLTTFESGRTIPGTRSYHHYSPVSQTEIGYKRVNDDKDVAGKFSFCNRNAEDFSKLKTMEFIACHYDTFWWVGLVQEIDEEQRDCLIQFMHPHGPSTSFKWPARDDQCWVPLDKLICTIDTPKTTSGRVYVLTDNDYTKIMELSRH